MGSASFGNDRSSQSQGRVDSGRDSSWSQSQSRSDNQSQRTTRSRDVPMVSSPLPGALANGPSRGGPSRTEMDLDLRFNPDVVAEVITIKKEAQNDYWDPVWVDRLSKYREEVKASDDLEDKFAFGRWVIEMGLNAKWSDPDPSYADRNRDGLLREGSRVIKKLAKGTLGKQGHPPAQFLLADYHSSGQAEPHIEKSHAKAFALYVAISKSYRPGTGVNAGSKKDTEMSVVAAQATYRAGACCEDGLGVKKDPLRAVQFYRKAASFSDTHAMYKMGHLYISGSLGVAKSPREGVSWLKRAASQADEAFPAPIHDLAQVYEGIIDTGGAAIKDNAYAYTLYLRAAQIGYAKSQYHLGLAHEIGLLGLPTDARRSIAWYNLGAQAGDPECELGLSGWYVTGCEGVMAPNDDLAYKWARSSAEKGYARAECALGFFIENGVGAPVDMNEAKYWYNRAAEQGDRRAQSRLEGLAKGWGPLGGNSSLNRRKSVRDEAVRRRELGRQGKLEEADGGRGCSVQ
ncbi:HCP-like protein [Gonapodya prolifera JEL478]|uniref:HCP-like protein n=1 Tax=Gonapodya prolifera (strain JEL478) TaxID=1344416 RepID=A0A139B038_GONPJ|nr:HCP-like protein [Gonapodya prolifera JEL478]|eukprot:KXS22362.1 HCP-like protein [Gonapodya prolifera JEL478]